MCNRLHPVEQRACRWLLLMQDRAASTTFELTHQFLGQMLGANRTTVSLALGALRRAGLVEFGRESLTVLDREGLAAASCECYTAIRDDYDRLLGAGVR